MQREISRSEFEIGEAELFRRRLQCTQTSQASKKIKRRKINSWKIWVKKNFRFLLPIPWIFLFQSFSSLVRKVFVFSFLCHYELRTENDNRSWGSVLLEIPMSFRNSDFFPPSFHLLFFTSTFSFRFFLLPSFSPLTKNTLCTRIDRKRIAQNCSRISAKFLRGVPRTVRRCHLVILFLELDAVSMPNIGRTPMADRKGGEGKRRDRAEIQNRKRRWKSA